MAAAVPGLDREVRPRQRGNGGRAHYPRGLVLPPAAHQPDDPDRRPRGVAPAPNRHHQPPPRRHDVGARWQRPASRGAPDHGGAGASHPRRGRRRRPGGVAWTTAGGRRRAPGQRPRLPPRLRAGRPSLAARFAGAWPRRRTGRLEPLPDRDLACPPDRRVRRPLPAGARMRRARHTPGPSRGLLDPPRRERLPCGEGRKYPGRPPTHRPAAPHGRSQRDRAGEGNPEPHRRARPRRHLPRGQPRRAGLHGLAARVARASIRVAARGLHPARPRRAHPRPRRREPRRPQPPEPHARPGALAIGPLRGVVGGGDSQARG